MKKNLLILSLIFILTACSSGINWDQPDPAMPPELKAKLEQELKDELATLKEKPEDSQILFYIAHDYDMLGHYKEAVDYYKKVLEVDSENWAALNNLANIYEDIGLYADAADYIKQLYTLDQANTEVIKDTVRILLKAQDATEAEEALDNFEKQVVTEKDSNPEMVQLIEELRKDIKAASNAV